MSAVNYSDIETSARRRLHGLGFGDEGQPGSAPAMITSPEGEIIFWPDGRRGIDSLNSVELGRWLGHLAGWAAYAAAELSVVDAVLPEAKAQHERALSLALLRADGKSVEQRKAEANVDEDVTAARAVLDEVEARRQLLRGQAASIEARYAAVSREIKRRELDHSGRTGGV